MEAAILIVARRGETTEPLLANVFLARKINAILGGAFVGPWDVDQIPDDWLQSILSIDRIGDIQTGIQKVEDIFSRWRSEHVRK